jgi:hypothetical protein
VLTKPLCFKNGVVMTNLFLLLIMSSLFACAKKPIFKVGIVNDSEVSVVQKAVESTHKLKFLKPVHVSVVSLAVARDIMRTQILDYSGGESNLKWRLRI